VHHISARFCRIFDVYAARVFFKMRHKTDVPSYSRGLLVSSVVKGKKVKFSHTRYRALGPELISVYRQSARR